MSPREMPRAMIQNNGGRSYAAGCINPAKPHVARTCHSFDSCLFMNHLRLQRVTVGSEFCITGTSTATGAFLVCGSWQLVK